jgi:hypothetical protein
LIIKTKNRIDGISAQITERIRIGNYLGDIENLNIAYTKGGMNLFMTYYHNYGKQKTNEDHYITLKDGIDTWEHSIFLPDINYGNSQQATVGLDYSINDKHSIGGQYQFYTSDYKNKSLITTSTELNNTLHESSLSESNSNNNSNQHLANVFYNGNINDRFSVLLNFDYLKNYDKRDQQSNENINNTDTKTVDIFNQTDYDLYAGKLTNSWKTNFGLVEFGAEYNNIAGNGFVRSNGSTEDTEFTNKEKKAAGFISYSYQISKINFAVGLRYEYTSEQSTENEDQNIIIDRDYSDWYPNVSISTMIKNTNISVAFNKRTQRPSFSQLNGNVIYINRFVFQKGNPYLKKSDIYDLNAQVKLNSLYINLGYTYSEDPVLLFIREQENTDNSILFTYANYPKYQELYSTINWNTKISFWQPNYSINMTKPFFSSHYDGQLINYEKFNYTIRMFNDFLLPEGWVLSCNFQHQSSRQDAFFETESYQRIDAGVRKSFLDNSLRLNMMAYDIFYGVKIKNRLKMNNVAWNANKKNETRYALFSITYVFNNYNKKYRGSSAAQDDIDRF